MNEDNFQKRKGQKFQNDYMKKSAKPTRLIKWTLIHIAYIYFALPEFNKIDS